MGGSATITIGPEVELSFGTGTSQLHSSPAPVRSLPFPSLPNQLEISASELTIGHVEQGVVLYTRLPTLRALP